MEKFINKSNIITKMVDLTAENIRLLKLPREIDADSVYGAILSKVVDATKYNDRGVERYRKPDQLSDAEKDTLAKRLSGELHYHVAKRQFRLHDDILLNTATATDANGTSYGEVVAEHYFRTNKSQMREMLNNSEITLPHFSRFAENLASGYRQKVDVEGITAAHSHDLTKIRAGITNLNEAKSLGSKVKVDELGLEDAIKAYIEMLNEARTRM